MEEFKAHKVNVSGLSRSEAKKKRRAEYVRWKTFQDMENVYKNETSKAKCSRKVHTSMGFVKENINSI